MPQSLANKKSNPGQSTFQDKCRRLLTKYGLEWDERYDWD
jgi:hypothetical protein